jgi:hypothetical protein
MDKRATISPNVSGFLLYLSGALTQYDQRASKRRGYNPYALGHYLEAVNKIRESLSKDKNSQEPEALEALKSAIGRHFFVTSMPPAKNTIKAIDEFLQTGKAPRYPGVKRAVEDFWMAKEDVAEVCPSCAEKMASLNVRRIRASVFFGVVDPEQIIVAARDRTAAKWQALPKGWTAESLEKFWGTLTGDAKNKVTACIKKMEGKVDDPGAFCASARDRIEGTTKWRGEREAGLVEATQDYQRHLAESETSELVKAAQAYKSHIN